MDKSAFWQQKIIQFFHDPPTKPYFRYGGSEWFKALVTRVLEDEDAERFLGRKSLKGHKRIAAALFEAHLGLPLKYAAGAPDWCASGADRPMLYAEGSGFNVYWPSRPILTHPLAPGFRLDTGAAGTDDEPTKQETARRLLQDQMEVAGGEALARPEWEDADGLEIAFVALWRRFRDELVARQRQAGDPSLPGSNPLWEEMPADSRCPDHSIWDHLRVTTALAFLKPHRMNETRWLDNRWEENAREPWLLRFSIGPVQTFITEARTGRDLWTGSMLLAELAWAAMEPFVERYGPDCVLYPDLRANPRVDSWLYDAYPDALRSDNNPSSFAALLPNAFAVVVPKGGEGHLEDLKTLAEQAEQRVAECWQALAGKVRTWLVKEIGNGSWTGIWDRQLEKPPLYCIWTAIPWLPLGCITDPQHLLARALPAQSPDFRKPENPSEAIRNQAVQAQRSDRLRPWLPPEVWSLYERTRLTYATCHLGYHQMERGFDYALTHHQLATRHALRKQSHPPIPGADLAEHGEKCTQCGKRQALTDAGDNAGGLDHLRQRARELWSHQALDPDRTGIDKLCGVCAVKRFLVQSDQDEDQLVFNRVWAGADPDKRARDRDDRLRVPFPSTATVAAQDFIEAVLRDGDLRTLVEALLNACRKAQLERTSFPRSLPRLTALAATLDAPTRVFLEYEPEDLLFPDAVEGKARGFDDRAERPGNEQQTEMFRKRAAGLSAVADASRNLLRAASERFAKVDGPTAPATRIAVIRMDGDHMGRLLLGDPDQIATRWCDVIHPDGVTKLQSNRSLLDAGWNDLLDAKRLMGPSLHAFVSRALGNFSHRIVPWVVEMEFSGRLIYAGGDDLLCLAPADQALDLAARLQQLFSAAWVLDTAPQPDPWAWRHSNWQGDYDPERARYRFAIPTMGSKQDPIRLPIQTIDGLELHVTWTENSGSPPVPAEGPILPMLGRRASLCAGIAYGHYKTPLSLLLGRSQALLDLAKKPYRNAEPPAGTSWTGRRALALGHASRGGVKTTFALPWGRTDRPPDAQRTVRGLIEAFRRGDLPSRLPYKLRGHALAVRQALKIIAAKPVEEGAKDDREERLMRGLLEACLDKPKVSEEVKHAALSLWRQGIRLHPDNPERYTDGLLLCRTLASGGDDEEGSDQ